MNVLYRSKTKWNAPHWPMFTCTESASVYASCSSVWFDVLHQFIIVYDDMKLDIIHWKSFIPYIYHIHRTKDFWVHSSYAEKDVYSKVLNAKILWLFPFSIFSFFSISFFKTMFSALRYVSCCRNHKLYLLQAEEKWLSS